MTPTCSTTIAFLFLAASAATAQAEDRPIEIPLKSVWAARMPGTRNIRDLEPPADGDRARYGPIMREIDGVLKFAKSEEDKAGRGFAVEGDGIEALRKVKAVLVDGAKRPEALNTGSITLVFYTRWTGSYVHLRKVTREKNVFTLRYCFAYHPTDEITAHLALIPLGVLPPGKYEVKNLQLFADYSAIRRPPLPQKRIPWESERRIVSLPFIFEVK